MATITLRLISRTLMALSRRLRAILIATGIAVAALMLVVQPSRAQNAFDKGTPAESKGGLSGLSTYAQDKVEVVNLANGNLTMQFPLVTIGGRGSATYTVSLAYNSKLWSGQHDAETITNPLDESQTIHHYSATYDDQAMTKPNLIALGSGWTILRGPAVRSRQVFSDVVPEPQVLHDPRIDHEGVRYKFILTKVWLTLPDGSEVELRDDLTDGAPAETPVDADGLRIHTDRYRGKVWRSTDGSAITYITDIDNGVVLGSLNGWVFLPDGTRVRMRGSTGGPPSASARCREIRDRNGNFLNIDYDVPVVGAVTYTDQLGRQVILQGGTQGATVTVKGYNGMADRVITIDTSVLAPNDNAAAAPNLRAEYQDSALWPRPFLNGDYQRTFFGDNPDSYPPPRTDLFSQSEGLDHIDDKTVVTRLNLLDGRSFVFRYNPWGEVAEIVYPGGGVSQIDYAPFGSGLFEPGPISPELNRRVVQRRVLSDGVTVDAVWAYSRSGVVVGTTLYPTVTVQVNQGSVSGPELMRETHYFLALDAEYRYRNPSAGGTISFDGVGYEKWENAKEFKVERAINATQTQIETHQWDQRASVAWPPDENQSFNRYVQIHSQEQPPNDTRMLQEDSILENNKLKRTTYGYDRFNNVTSVIEYDFGTNPNPGPVLRRTTRTYAIDALLNGYCYSNLSALAGSCSSAVSDGSDDVLHQRRLLLSEEVRDGVGALEARSELEYDVYTADGNHAPVAANAGMIQYNGSRFLIFNPQFEPLGNVTRVRKWISGATYAESYTQYDQAGNVVKTIDSRGNSTTMSYADDFGDGASPGFGVAGTNGPTFAMPTTATNALGQMVRSQHHYTRGVVTGIKDPNNVITRTEYNDPYDRPTRVISGYGLTGPETATVEFTYPTAGSNTTTVSKQLD
ncbi:MAG TPA: hypothetical protein VJH03_03850, partial [Blastocatellia bacterium]|nr:hypothetical protein [Blastocatellia bacterium]